MHISLEQQLRTSLIRTSELLDSELILLTNWLFQSYRKCISVKVVCS